MNREGEDAPKMTPAEHHARFCEAVGPKPQGPLENCPFRPWHEGKQEPR